MMNTGMMAALALSAAAGFGMVGNEMTHGGFAETMGLGHHHAADFGGVHCASHAGTMGASHTQHMHDGNFTAHGSCRGGAGMHGNMSGGMGGGMRNG